MIRCRLALMVVLWAGMECAAGVQPPNGSFEEGISAPTGWRTVGEGGRWTEGGAADGRCAVAVSGAGQTSTSWQSDPIAFSPGKVYRLRFHARGQGMSGGTAISGPAFCNRDLGAIGETWALYESVFAAPLRLRPDELFLRFGQWHARGVVMFDAVELCEAIPVYARVADLALGEGERVEDTQYTFDAPFRGQSRNHARALAGHVGVFNTDRWSMSRGSEVVYRHEVGARNQSRAEVRIGVTWYAAGRLIVEAGADGARWQRIGVITGLAEETFAVPADLLPGRNVWIRLRPEAMDNQPGEPALQVGSYVYRSTIDGAPAHAIGVTQFAAVERTDDRLDVAILDLGDALPGGRNVIVADVTNKTPVPIQANVGAGTEAKAMTFAPGRTTVRLPYDLPGAGARSVRLVVGAFAAQTTLHIAGLHDASYGQLLDNTADAALWWCSSGWKISQMRPAPKAKGTALRIAAARNEVEAAQLVVRPTKAIRGLTASASDLRGLDGAVIPAASVEILRVRYVQVTRPTDAAGCTGWWPDPLPPFSGGIDLEPGHNQPLWVRIRTPRNAAAGVYRGTIRLAAEAWSAEALLEVEVYDFTLPDRMTCTTTFGFTPREVYRYHKLTSEADRRTVIEKYLKNFSEHHISPYDPAPLDRFKVTWKGGDAPVVVFDFSQWDVAMSRAIDEYHFNAFVLPLQGMGGGTFHERVDPELLGQKEDSPQYKAAFTSYCRQLEAHLREKGWLDEAYAYWFDEPDPKDYAFVMNGFRKLREAAPGINRMLTEQVEPELAGGPNIWCPVSPDYDHARALERRKQGDRFWWYVCTAPKAPYATLFIDHPGTEMRVWLWQTWQRGIEGILIWGTNYWTSPTAYPDQDRPQNPYEDPMGWVSGYGTKIGVRQPWGNGDGRFIYPPESAADANPPGPMLDGPVDSIRWEMLRDGVEDYEYLAILRRLVDQKAGRLTGDEKAAALRLLDVPPDITADMTTFTSDPTPIERRRGDVARMIEKLNR